MAAALLFEWALGVEVDGLGRPSNVLWVPILLHSSSDSGLLGPGPLLSERERLKGMVSLLYQAYQY